MADYEIYYKDGRGLRFAFPYKPELIESIKRSIPGIKWDKDAKRWGLEEGTILDDNLVEAIRKFAKDNRFEISEKAGKYLGVTGTQIKAPDIDLTYNTRNEKGDDARVALFTMQDKNYIAVVTPYSEALVNKFHNISGAKWDSEAKRWLVPIASNDELDKLTSTIKSEFPEVISKVKEQKDKDKKEGLISISEGEGYGGTPFREGQILRWKYLPEEAKGQIVKVVSAGSTYYREDGMSFGVGDESGHIYRAKVKLATPEEAQTIINVEKQRAIKTKAKERLNEIETTIRDRDNLTPVRAAYPQGDVLENTFNIYGGGKQLIISPDAIWYIQNNGADGDNWGNTNIGTPGYAGSIGWRVNYDEKLANELRQLARIAKEPKPDDELPQKEQISKYKELVSKPKVNTSNDKPIGKTKSNPVRIHTDKLPNLTELRAINSERSERSQDSDNRQKHQLIVGYRDPKVKRWINHPGDMDVLKIDTPKGIKTPTYKTPKVTPPKLKSKRVGKIYHTKVSRGELLSTRPLGKRRSK